MENPAPLTIPDEFCDQCNAKINLQRVYYNGRKICPVCYTHELNKNFSKLLLGWECPRCHQVHNPLTLICNCLSHINE